VGVEGLSVSNSDRETCFSKRNFFEFQKKGDAFGPKLKKKKSGF